MITVFTSTYNRGYLLANLYRSLCDQTCQNFEWLIIDDGSLDETEAIINEFVLEKKIDIRYFKQDNSGKHVAINRGVEKAKGELFFIVDSDDVLVENAIERLNYFYNQIKDNDSFAGVSGTCLTLFGNRIGGDMRYNQLDCSPLELRIKYKISGDMSEAVKTKILRNYSFPVFEGEKFCPEALVWNRLSQRYIFRYFNEGLCKCEYRSDGLSAKIVRLRMDSSRASLLYYSELYHMNIPFLHKIKAAINYWRFSFGSNDMILNKIRTIGLLSLLVFPVALLFHYNDLKK